MASANAALLEHRPIWVYVIGQLTLLQIFGRNRVQGRLSGWKTNRKSGAVVSPVKRLEVFFPNAPSNCLQLKMNACTISPSAFAKHKHYSSPRKGYTPQSRHVHCILFVHTCSYSLLLYFGRGVDLASLSSGREY